MLRWSWMVLRKINGWTFSHIFTRLTKLYFCQFLSFEEHKGSRLSHILLKMRIRIRASSTMVGIQAMTRSISQFLNRRSQTRGGGTGRTEEWLGTLGLQRTSHARSASFPPLRGPGSLKDRIRARRPREERLTSEIPRVQSLISDWADKALMSWWQIFWIPP